MISTSTGMPSWQLLAAHSTDVTLHWYAIADAAQSQTLPEVLTRSTGMPSRCLFNTTTGSPISAKTPHLVALPAPNTFGESTHAAWRWIERNAPNAPCITILASALNFDRLYTHLRQWTDVVLPDGEDMYFAFWDPMILGTLMGQADDPTLEVPGPVLNKVQRTTLTQGIAGWWYWDRDGGSHSLGIDTEDKPIVASPLQLTQMQVDDLVEASVPDHVLHYLELNQPLLLAPIDVKQRYGIVRKHLRHAREIGLSGTGDMVNFVCAALIYGPSLQQDPYISALLEQVRDQRLTLDQALNAMP